MTSLVKNIFILTSDGTRTTDMNKLISSIDNIKNKFIVFVNQSPIPSNYSGLFEQYTIDYHIIDICHIAPLAIVRNLALDYIENYLYPSDIDRIIYSDDDCYYSQDYCNFLNHENSNDVINVFPVVDENNNFFTSKGVPEIKSTKKIKKQDIMFYTCSISFILPYKISKGYRFNEKIGLGNVINQGEETDYLERLISEKKINFIFQPNIKIFHPRKTNYPNKVFYSLAYFLSYKCVHSSNKSLYFKYSILFFSKYILFSIFLVWKKKYRGLLFHTLHGVKDGIRDKHLCFN
ncbi:MULTISPECIES: hypothetical protein [Providencia]|uniref:hypothetical protein n=1 Tax=Providencia TaxID=586 RepID=UPI0015D54BDE|nr:MULTISPECIES: hypothetical protein [Providencia]MDH2377311.1 hypothetical protein [Providencia rettgeri]QLI99189.1 hypothetical protein H0A34_20330 [Providencia rettgeri]